MHKRHCRNLDRHERNYVPTETDTESINSPQKWWWQGGQSKQCEFGPDNLLKQQKHTDVKHPWLFQLIMKGNLIKVTADKRFISENFNIICNNIAPNRPQLLQKCMLL
uniref:Uncharacterized protein n=1 Tax=Salix viminalis TaxID=40686 RepID=A0A6N2KHL5_SALVM